MKRSVVRRLIAAVAGAAVLAMAAAACGTPPRAKISWTFGVLPLASPGAGLYAGANANFTYKAGGVPAGGEILLQKASVSGIAVKWSTVAPLEVDPIGRGVIIRPPFGRNTYRLAVVDAKGKVLASAFHGLDVYKRFTLAQITTRPEQELKFADGSTFTYVFQAEIFIEHTSCRSLGALDLYNKGPMARQLQVSHTIAGKTKSTSYVVRVSKGSFEVLFYYGLPLTPGEDLDLHVLDNSTYGSTVYGDGSAQCFTDTGEF